MSYLALYRKYRPSNFDEVIGQDDVVQILKNQILADRIGHAYLLTGIRGTGKTSIAKIFARAVNCGANSDGNPCNQCDICKSIEQAGVMDIIEIDAASNRGVDEIREIKDKVIYPPKMGRYKVYIIDEVHMLTKEAFNALLKTLEEPPSHIVFILATTEPNKLPATILSRCQRFDIHPISQEKISEQIRYILDDNQIKMDDEAINLIAARGDHSMRDALSILDQAIDIRKGEECITCEAVTHFLGMAEQDILLKLAASVLNNDAGAVIQLLNNLKQKGLDALQLTGQLIDLFRKMAIVKTVGNKAQQILESGQAEIENLKSVCVGIPVERFFGIIEGLIEDRQKMRYNDLTEVILEMALLKQCREHEKTETPPAEVTPQRNISLDNSIKDKKKIIETKVKALPENRNETDLSAKAKKAAVIVPEAETVSDQSAETMQKVQEVQNVQECVKEEAGDQGEKGEVKSEKASEAKAVDAIEDNSGNLSVIRQAIEAWNGKQDFFTSQVVAYGKLRYNGNDSYTMMFHSPEHNMYAEMFKGRIRQQIQEVISNVIGRKILLTSECSSKDFEEMDFAEKTAAIIGSEYKDKIKILD